MTAHGTEVAEGGDYRPHMAYAMRPLSLGEILDRSFAVYRANFWLFVGIAVLSAAVQLVANAVLLLIYKGYIPNPRTTKVPLHLAGQQIGSWFAMLLFFLATAVTQAATVWALSEVYLGRRATIGDSLRAVAGRWLRFVGIGLWQAWSFMWLPMLLLVPAMILVVVYAVRFGVGGAFAAGVLIFLAVTGGVVFGAIAFLRNSLAVQAAVVEGLEVRQAMRRSKVLAAGAKLRIFVVYLIAWCLFLVAGVIEAPLAMVVGIGALKGERHVLLQAVILLVNFVAHSAVTPVLMIGLSLVYFDQRVRHEGFDLLLMLNDGATVGASGSMTTLQPSEPASDAAPL